MTHIIVYDINTHRPLYTAELSSVVTQEWFDNKGIPNFLWEDNDIHNKYVENEQLLPMSKMNLEYGDTKINMIDTFTVNNVPENTEIIIDKINMGIIEDGKLEFNAEEAGQYELVFSNSPKFIEDKIVVTVS
jgi:hypothetical protein